MSSSLKTKAAITTGVLLASFLLYHKSAVSTFCTKHRGFRGLIRYIWIGDHLPPSIRKSVNDLDEICHDMMKCEHQLEQIEIMIQRALLECVDGPTTMSTDMNDPNKTNTESKDEIQKQIFQQNPELRKDIGFFSTRLDRLAARIDSVLSYLDDEVKMRRKQLSNKVVELMEELDNMIAMLHSASR
ncbi:hypothetical protein ACHAWO_008333 [Cyclotella atomus]|uniref:BAG domain-containing protein n=1 Tax=Cyclotella atomus TaxID=382360 RepID=A0ABD3Q2D4_9STRA